MIMPRAIRQPLRRFAQVGTRRRALVIEATLLLALARIALIVLPFEKLVRLFGTAGTHRNSTATSANAVHIAQDIGWAITRTAPHLPFRAVCLPQAIAARMMLRRRGIASVLHFGAAKDATRIDAHAWLDAEGVEITGYPVEPRFTELACYA